MSNDRLVVGIKHNHTRHVVRLDTDPVFPKQPHPLRNKASRFLLNVATCLFD